MFVCRSDSQHSKEPPHSVSDGTKKNDTCAGDTRTGKRFVPSGRRVPHSPAEDAARGSAVDDFSLMFGEFVLAKKGLFDLFGIPDPPDETFLGCPSMYMIQTIYCCAGRLVVHVRNMFG